MKKAKISATFVIVLRPLIERFIDFKGGGQQRNFGAENYYPALYTCVYNAYYDFENSTNHRFFFFLYFSKIKNLWFTTMFYE